MAKAWRALAVITTGALLLGGGVAHAASAKKPRKPKATTTTVTTENGTDNLTSTLSPNSCALDLTTIPPVAPLATGTVGTIEFVGQTVTAVELPDPIPITIHEPGMRMTCTIQAGSDTNQREDDVVIDVVDFPGPKGLDAAKRAYAAVKAAYQPDQLGAANPDGPPEDLSGLGDEAFVAGRGGGTARAFVTRQGEILVRVDASQSSSTVSAPLDFDAVKGLTGVVLARAVAEVPTATGNGSSTANGSNPKGNTGSGRITTSGAINATWNLRLADLGITEGCSIIPLVSDDGTMTAAVNPLTSGQVTFIIKKFPQNLRGTGAKMVLPPDPEVDAPPYHVDIDATVKDPFTGGHKMKIKGSFDYTCKD